MFGEEWTLLFRIKANVYTWSGLASKLYMLCKLYRLVCTAIIVVLKQTAWSLIALPLPHFFSTLRTLLITALLTKRRTLVSVQTGTQGVARCNRKTCMQSVRCTWLLQSHWILKGQRSLRPHAQCNWIFFLHILLCTHGKRVCVKRAVIKTLGWILRVNRVRTVWGPIYGAVAATRLSMGFSMLASPNPFFQWVSLPRSRKSKQ